MISVIAVFPLKTGDLMFVGFDSQNTSHNFPYYPDRNQKSDRKVVESLVPKRKSRVRAGNVGVVSTTSTADDFTVITKKIYVLGFRLQS